MALRDELEDRFGPLPAPVENLILLQQARIKLGLAGIRTVSLRQGRLTVTPLDLEAARAESLKAQLPESTYEPGRSKLTVKMPADDAEHFPAVVEAADAVLAVTRESA